MPNIWNKYKITKILKLGQNIKTYLANFEPIIKEIIPKDAENKFQIYEYFDKLKEELKIYEIIEENDKIYLIVMHDEKINKRIDDIILLNEYSIKKECILEEHGEPVTKEEILNLFKFEESMCKIKCEKLINNAIQAGKGTGFFCEIEKDKSPIRYCLFTNNHLLDEDSIELNKIVKFEYFNGKKYVEKEIKITKDRKVFTNKELDYTCIEIFKSDGIKKFFKVDPYLHKIKDNNFYKDKDIFVLQYPKGYDISFSVGKIKKTEKNRLSHSASTDKGSSGSPIIRRNKDSKENYVIGIHFGGKKDNNLATKIDCILEDLKSNEINCVYTIEEYVKEYYTKEIQLMHDYDLPKELIENFSEERKKVYYEAKEINKNLFKNNIELYVNDKKIKFDFKYKINGLNEIKVRFIFKINLTNISHIFFGCSFLSSIDLSSLNTNNVKDMSYMFCGCSSLKSIDLSTLNTNNVEDMSYMFYKCASLKSIDLSSLNTSNVNNMSNMFSSCSSLESIDLSSLNTSKVNNMSNIFYDC